MLFSEQPFFNSRFACDGYEGISRVRYCFAKFFFIERLLAENFGEVFFTGGRNFFNLEFPAYNVVDMRFAHGAGHTLDFKRGFNHFISRQDRLRGR